MFKQSPLLDIRAFVKQVVDAVALALKVEVVVTDCNLQLVATSENMSNEFLIYHGNGSLTREILETKKPVIVKVKSQDPLCRMHIPAETGHPFRFKPDTHSNPFRTPIPK